MVHEESLAETNPGILGRLRIACSLLKKLTSIGTVDSPGEV